MFKSLLFSTVLVAGLTVQASELDRDMSNVQNPELNGTIIMKVEKKTGKVEVLKIDKKIVSSKEEAIALSKSNKFVPVTRDQVRTELDADAGSSSWYFYYGGGCGYNYYNCYPNYYYNNCYYPSYYNYATPYYNYYYYGAYNRWY